MVKYGIINTTDLIVSLSFQLKYRTYVPLYIIIYYRPLHLPMVYLKPIV